MQTTNDRIKKFCEDRKYELPYGHHLLIIGSAVVSELKEQEKYVGVEKLTVQSEMIVNSYPDELAPIIDETIAAYYKDRIGFVAKYKAGKTGKIKKFMYVVEAHKVTAFESALTKLEIPIERNEGFDKKGGKVQYILPLASCGRLVTIGKEFQKARDYEKWQLRRQLKDAVSHTIVPTDADANLSDQVKLVDKRVRKKIENNNSNK